MPSVAFERTIVVSAAPSTVWETLTEVQRVGGWVTVMGEIREISRLDHYETVLADRLGPFKLSADLVAKVTELTEPVAISVLAGGEDRQVSSRIRIAVTLSISEQADGTAVAVSGEHEVTGKVATLGASMIRSKGDKILDEFFTAPGRRSRECAPRLRTRSARNSCRRSRFGLLRRCPVLRRHRVAARHDAPRSGLLTGPPCRCPRR